MPIYTYVCDECVEKFEVLQSMSDKPLKRVPMSDGPCGKKCKSKVTRVLTVPNVNIRQGQSETVVDRKPNGDPQAEVTKHWDGRQDVTVMPDVAKLKPSMPSPG